MMTWDCIDPLDPVDLMVFSDVLQDRGDLRGAAALRYLVRHNIRPAKDREPEWWYYLHSHPPHLQTSKESGRHDHWLFRELVGTPKKSVYPCYSVMCFPPGETGDEWTNRIFLSAHPNPPLALLRWLCENWRLPPEEGS